jgi:hypothetical protein
MFVPRAGLVTFASLTFSTGRGSSGTARRTARSCRGKHLLGGVRVLGGWGRSQPSGRRPLGLLRDSPHRAVSDIRRDGGRVGRMRPFEPPRLAAPLAAGLKRPALRLAGRAPTALPN